MNLQDVFDHLSDGEFSQLSIGGASAGVIDETNHLKVLGHVNLALTALFTRFSLKEGNLVVPLVAETYSYALSAGDIIKVERIFTDSEVELPLNVSGDVYSCFTPSMNTLVVPETIADQGADVDQSLWTDSLKVVYRANHPKIKPVAGFLIPSAVNVELPDTHLLPLLYFVASRVHNPIGMSNEFHAGNSYYAKYEATCQALEGKGIQIDQERFNDRLARNGWV